MTKCKTREQIIYKRILNKKNKYDKEQQPLEHAHTDSGGFKHVMHVSIQASREGNWCNSST